MVADLMKSLLLGFLIRLLVRSLKSLSFQYPPFIQSEGYL
jgi:hypothetical protein